MTGVVRRLACAVTLLIPPRQCPRGLLKHVQSIRRLRSASRRIARASCPRLSPRRRHRQLRADHRAHPSPHLELVRRPQAAGLPVGAKPLLRPRIRGRPQRRMRPLRDGHARQLGRHHAGRLAAVEPVLCHNPRRLALVRPGPGVASPEAGIAWISAPPPTASHNPAVRQRSVPARRPRGGPGHLFCSASEALASGAASADCGTSRCSSFIIFGSHGFIVDVRLSCSSG